MKRLRTIKFLKFSSVSLLLLLLVQVQAIGKEMTVLVDAGKKECFFQTVKFGETIDLEYRVINGGHGDLDINFSLLDPSDSLMVNDVKKPQNMHSYEVQYEGDYRFCFDNTFSTFNRKTVFFELMVARDGEQNFDDGQWNDLPENLTLAVYDITEKDIMNYVRRIHYQLMKARQIQDMLMSLEARDRNLAESNFTIVNMWSLFQVSVMLAVGLLQVYLVRSIFETNTRMSRVWHKLRI